MPPNGRLDGGADTGRTAAANHDIAVWLTGTRRLFSATFPSGVMESSTVSAAESTFPAESSKVAAPAFFRKSRLSIASVYYLVTTMSSRNHCPVLLNASLSKPSLRHAHSKCTPHKTVGTLRKLVGRIRLHLDRTVALGHLYRDILFIDGSVELHRTTALNETTMSVGVEPSDASAGVVSTLFAARRTYPMEAVTVPETLQPSGAS